MCSGTGGRTATAVLLITEGLVSTAQIDLGDDLAALLHALNQPVEQTARQFIVLELYRRGSISSGKAAELLGTSRWQFIHHASQLGVPYLEMTEDEWRTERTSIDKL